MRACIRTCVCARAHACPSTPGPELASRGGLLWSSAECGASRTRAQREAVYSRHQAYQFFERFFCKSARSFCTCGWSSPLSPLRPPGQSSVTHSEVSRGVACRGSLGYRGMATVFPQKPSLPHALLLVMRGSVPPAGWRAVWRVSFDILPAVRRPREARRAMRGCARLAGRGAMVR